MSTVGGEKSVIVGIAVAVVVVGSTIPQICALSLLLLLLLLVVVELVQIAVIGGRD
jgi:hypothetical protein